ncbi:polysaccharide pyruvyl transferase family protein [Microcella sp.]|uniref:polysaccharide pyruvyl transferase family protein n=1 Tax=Microcella sp. TaxID=1913979 RepID=UPI00299F66FE|nr:polysaccharide pyruvyl transferase family protein [Microcella sp.]MDX2026905.1 polysaccharide pyruvyl transferase family protein [Microcella sp.]
MTNTTHTPTRVVMLGTHGQYNIGDELLLATVLRQLGTQHEYVVNTYDAADTAARIDPDYQVELINTAGDRLALLRHLRRADAVVFAGGSILKELSAATGRNRYATLLMILAVVTATRVIGRAPMAMLNIGVGPIRTRFGRWLAGRIMNQVTLVTVRDAGSAALCERIGVRRPVVSSTDAVFSVEPEWLRGGAPRPAADSGTLRIGLSLNHDIDTPENWEHVVATLAQAVRDLAAERPIEIHGLPMQSRGKTHDDATVLRDFAERIAPVPFVEHRPDAITEVARIIEQCDLIVAERLHAIITSAKLGVPVVPLAYDVKVRQVASVLGLDDVSIDLSAPFTAADVHHSIARVADDQRGARAALARNTDLLTVRARAGFDQARAWLAGVRA